MAVTIALAAGLHRGSMAVTIALVCMTRPAAGLYRDSMVVTIALAAGEIVWL